MDQMFRRKADADGIGAYRPNGFRPSENPVSSVLAMNFWGQTPTEFWGQTPAELLQPRAANL